jgi:hypothetical protein
MNAMFSSLVITGEEFSNIYPTVIKFTNASANHRGVVFEVGKTVTDPLPWSVGECKPGGIYFTIPTYFLIWNHNYSSEIGQITRVFSARVPPDATVAVFDNKAKATSLEIIEELDFCQEKERYERQERRQKERKRQEEEERKRQEEEERKRQEEEERKRQEEERKRQEELLRKQKREQRINRLGIRFHSFMNPKIVDEIKERLASDELYPLVCLLVQVATPDIKDPRFDSIYGAIFDCSKKANKRLWFLPFFCPRFVHVVYEKGKRSTFCESEEANALVLYPEFFSTQKYFKDLVPVLRSVSHVYPDIRKAFGMI